MRTTLNVDDDVLLAAKQKAALEGVSVGEALSAIAREGLRSAKGRRTRNGVRFNWKYPTATSPGSRKNMR